MRDELDARIRALEAERLRPVPPPPGRTPSTTVHNRPVDELHVRRARRATPPPDPAGDRALRALRAAGDKYRQKNGEADT